MRTQTPKIFLFASTRLFAPLSMSATYVVNTVDEHKTCVCEECVTVAQRRCGFSFEISAASLLASPSGGAALLQRLSPRLRFGPKSGRCAPRNSLTL
jgi:hypothetical protein